MAWLNEEFGPGVATYYEDGSDDVTPFIDSVINSAQTGNTEWADMIRSVYDRADYNNAFAAEQAEKANAFTHEQNQLAMQFSASEAAKNREWQEEMSNTAHQREVQDLIAAGLNPVLSVNAGASTPSGSAASGVTGNGKAATPDTTDLTGLYSTAINSATQMAGYEKQKEIAQLQTAATIEAAAMSAAAMKYSADLSYESSKYKSDQDYAASLYAAIKKSGDSKYAADHSYWSALESAQKSYEAAKLGAEASKENNQNTNDTNADMNKYTNDTNADMNTKSNWAKIAQTYLSFPLIIGSYMAGKGKGFLNANRWK